MNRRDALRMLTAGAVIPALSPELFAFYRETHPEGPYALRTLNPHQNDTVVAMIDQIIPATDTPGAKGARVTNSSTSSLPNGPPKKSAAIFSMALPPSTNKA